MKRFNKNINWIISISICLTCALFVTSSCGQESSSQKKKGFIVSDPIPDNNDEIKILLYYDMEGISGLNDMRSLNYGNEGYTAARDLLTNDVNAVIDGLFAGGADIVDVVDAHGSGNPEPDILLDKMDSRVKLISRDKPFRSYCDLTEKKVYDAIAVVCMHSKTGGGGFAAHTYTIGMDWIFNDMSINETEIIAYSWGRADIPLIFASGDDKLKEQLEYLPWIEYVTVKIAKGASDAELIPLDKVHNDMKLKAKIAVENISKAKVVNFSTPIKTQLRAVHPSSLGLLNGVPGINYQDNIVTFIADDFQIAYDGVTALIGVASRSWVNILHESIRQENNSSKIYNNYSNKLIARWGDVESGRWELPDNLQAGQSNRKYFGAR
ncbi:M55 family metallopeptidase [Bacteroidota bacterium]